MNINKLDLLSKGWKASEIDHASRVIAHAEEHKHSRSKAIDKILIVVLAGLLLVNVFVCSAVIIPFIYAMHSSFVIVIVSLIAFIFSVLFTIAIYDVEKTHPRRELDLFIGFIITSLINFYFIIYFSGQFGTKSGLTLTHNIYVIASIYAAVFLIPHIVYQIRKNREI